jgi:Protein of unknown function (DUF4011)
MTSEAGNHPGSTSSFREQLIDEARRKWVDRLIDLSRRNNLLYYRPLQSGTIELDSDTIKLGGLLTGKPLPFDEFAGREIERPGRLREIGRKALENVEEKGLVTLYLALGKATWPADDGGRDPEAPVVLVPITFQQRGQVDSTLSVQLNGEPQVNPVLLHVLKTQFNVTIEPVQLLSSVAASTIGTANGSEESEESTLDIPQVLERLTEKLLA